MNNRPLMFEPERILYEDNHLIVVNKRSGELVQPDPTGDPALEDEVKEMIRVRDGKPGAVFLGIVHRIDRPVSGAVLFAKTSKALARMNETVKNESGFPGGPCPVLGVVPDTSGIYSTGGLTARTICLLPRAPGRRFTSNPASRRLRLTVPLAE